MTRKRVFLFLGLPVLASVGFLAWMTRGFYVTVAVPEMRELPAEYREDAKALIREHALVRPNRWTMLAVTDCFKDPFDANWYPKSPLLYTKVDAATKEVLEVAVTRGRPRGTFWSDERQLVFYRQKEGWRVGVFDRGRMVLMRDVERR